MSVLCPHLTHHLFSHMLGWISDPTQFKAEVHGKMGIREDIMHSKEISELRVMSRNTNRIVLWLQQSCPVYCAFMPKTPYFA